MRSDRPLAPLTVAELGQVLTQGLMLYRHHWRDYSILALKAYAWLWVPLYGWNRYMTISGIIARLGFSQLNQEDLNLKQVQADLKRCGFKFFWLSLRLWWRILWVSSLVVFLGSMPVGILITALNLDSSNPEQLLSSPFFILFALAIYLFPTWPYSTLFLAEMPLAISPDQSIKESLNASRQLSQGNRWQILGLILSTMIVAAPIATLIGHLLPSIWQLFRTGLTLNFNTVSLVTTPIIAPLYTSSPLMVGAFWGAGIYHLTNATNWEMVISMLLTVTCTTTAAIALLPLWQLVKSALYYKLLSRLEGIDLQLLPRSSAIP